MGLIKTTLEKIQEIRQVGWDELVKVVNDFFLKYNIVMRNMEDIRTSNGVHMLFYKIWHSSPLFFSQTMADRILRVPTNFHIPWRSAFFRGYNGLTSSLAKLVARR
jgi:hypothetical protein